MGDASYGDVVKARVRTLLERFLAYANHELEDGELYKIDCNWETPKQVIVRTQKRVLAELSGLKNEQVGEGLNAFKDFLKILEDLRVHTQGSKNWHFRLRLWYDKDDKAGNLQKFDAEWQRLREVKPGVQRAEAKKAKLAPTPYNNLPLAVPREKFVGRDAELQNLHQLLQENQQVAIAAIAGMGGVGKTELALQYANSHRLTYQGGICWLSAPQDVGVQLVQFARTYLKLSIPDDLDLVGRVQHCLRNWHEGEVLLVIDNVTNYREEVRCYLESVPSRFKQLITTREKLQPPIVRLDLDVLTPLAAMQLLKSIVGRERLRREPLVARELCKRLGYLPLGLELVGRYLLGDEELSLVEMLQDLEKEGLNHEALKEVPQEMRVKLGVAAAFELSWRRLRENAQHLGCLLSLFAQAPIPWELVEGITINNEAQNWKQARRELLQLHLLQHKAERVYQLHPLLREFFQDKLTGLEQADEFKRAFCQVMISVAQEIPHSPTIQQIKDVAPAIPHLTQVANDLIKFASDDDLMWPFVGNARFYECQGLYNKAEPWCYKCLEVTKKLLGEEHPRIAASLNNLAEVYRSQGRYSEAEPLYCQALAMQRKLLGEKHPDIATSLNNLALLYDFQGRYSEAESLYCQALAMRRKLLGEEHPDVATSLNNLAEVYRSQGRYSEAESLYCQALAMRCKLLGEDHPDVATSLNNLAEVYRSQGRYSEAELVFIQALAMLRKLLGEEHPHTAVSLNNLAGLYHLQGRYSEAQPLYCQVLAMRRKHLGEEHPYVATSLNNLAELYRCQGRYSEAEPLYSQALAMSCKLLGEDHPDVAQSLNNLAGLYCSQGRYSEAEPLYSQALAMSGKLLGEEHPDIATSLNNLAEVYRCQGRYSEAELVYSQALAMWRKHLGEEHPNIATSLNNLAILYRDQGRYSEAEPLFIQALEIFERLLGVNHPDTVTVSKNLAYVRDRLNSPQQ